MDSSDIAKVTFFSIVVGLPILGWIITAAVTEWRKARVAEQEAVLKQSMIEKGFGPDDILRVLAGGHSPHTVAAADLTAVLIEQEYEADDIAAISGAFDQLPPAAREAVGRHARQMAEGRYDGADIVKFIDARAEAAKMAGETQAPAV
ncbi:MAG: hypothetical protein U0871_08745 [Gemmataceae bacterium]